MRGRLPRCWRFELTQTRCEVEACTQTHMHCMSGARCELGAQRCAASECCCCFALRQQGALWLFEKSQSPAPLSCPVASKAGLCLVKINLKKKKK